MADPILGISFGKLMVGVGLLEIAVAAHCLFRPRRIFTNASLIAWLSTSFLVYRLGLWGMDWHKPCGCLGGLADALHLRPETADTLIKGLLAWLLVGSCWVLFGHRLHGARPTTSAGPKSAVGLLEWLILFGVGSAMPSSAMQSPSLTARGRIAYPKHLGAEHYTIAPAIQGDRQGGGRPGEEQPPPPPETTNSAACNESRHI